MRTTVKLTLAALTAATLLASLVGSASARNFRLTNSNFRFVWAPLTFAEPFAFFTLRCNVTMEGTFHSTTITKTPETLIGFVTRANWGHPCTGGEGWAWNGTEGALTGANSLPWHIRYKSFTGTLPNITAIRLALIRPKFTIQVPFVCLGTYQPASMGGTINVAADRTMTITHGTEEAEAIEGTSCPPARFSGTSGRVTLLGTTIPISVTLI